MLERPDRRNRVVVAAAVAVAALVLTVQLFVEPVVGLADNGDFERLLAPAGLAHTSALSEERYFGWMQPRFAYTARTATPSGYRTSEYFLVDLAVRASRTLSRAPYFDVRWIGALHALLFLLALGLMVSACRDLALPAQAAAAFLLVFFFTDVGYTAPFLSLYAQTGSLLFLFVTAAVAAVAVRRGGLSGVWLPTYFAAAALFVCSKPQEVVHALLLALLGVRLAWAGGPTRRRAASVALAVLLCVLAARYGWSGEKSHGWITRYNVIFMNILPASPDPAGDLAELGLDPALARYSGVSAWVAESPGRDPEFQARMHRTSPRAFLLRHPERLRPMVAEAVRSSYELRPRAFGNYAKESGRPAGAMAPGPWSAARRVLSGWPWLFFLLGGTLTAAAATYRAASPRGRLCRECLAAAAVTAAGAFAVAFAGDTHVELVRHLYTFQALCDLILVADLVWIVQVVSVRGWTNRRIAAGGVALAGAFLGAQLFARPIVGLADNGDFERVMSPLGLRHVGPAVEDRYFGWIPAKLARTKAGWSPTVHRTSESLLAGAAVAVSRPFSSEGTFDIRWIGAVHAVLLLVALFLMVSATASLRLPAQTTAALLLAFLFTDVAYVAPLNSLYAQAASFLFLTLAVGFAAALIGRVFPAPAMLAGYFLCAALFVGSRPQEVIHAPVLAAFGARLTLAVFPRRRLRAAALSLGLCVVAVGYFLQVPTWVRRTALYHAVFYELLPHSPEPAADLARLGLPADFLRYSGTTAYSPNTGSWTPELQKALESTIGYDRLFAAASAWRREEVESLRWEQVDLKAREIRLADSKNGRPRTLPLDAGLFELVERAEKRRDFSQFVFHLKGRRVGDWRKRCEPPASRRAWGAGSRKGRRSWATKGRSSMICAGAAFETWSGLAFLSPWSWR